MDLHILSVRTTLIPEFGLILEDMHDENVIARNDALFFIDTVFYIMERK